MRNGGCARLQGQLKRWPIEHSARVATVGCSIARAPGILRKAPGCSDCTKAERQRAGNCVWARALASQLAGRGCWRQPCVGQGSRPVARGGAWHGRGGTRSGWWAGSSAQARALIPQLGGRGRWRQPCVGQVPCAKLGLRLSCCSVDCRTFPLRPWPIVKSIVPRICRLSVRLGNSCGQQFGPPTRTLLPHIVAVVQHPKRPSDWLSGKGVVPFSSLA